MILRMRTCILLSLTLALCVTSDAVSSTISRMCARFPAGTASSPRPGDNGYEIRVTEVGRYRKVQRFKPGRTYEVTIRSRYPLESFSNFYLTAVVDKMKRKMKNNVTASPGNFVHVANPPRTTNVEQCPGVVTAAYRGAMSKVHLRWTAPDFAKDCVMFKATVVKSFPGVYFKDAGRLTHTVCPQYVYASDEAIPERMMPAVRECCACGTATYKMTFQGKWIRQLHPRDWPKNEGYIHWSNIIGASHNREYFIYYYGGMAGEGVRSVCQFGDPSVLEGEFKTEAGTNILNIIKTRGIWEAKNMGESRTAIFAVNRTHHLMSMLTMMGPSPDWCAGISAKDLCMPNCTWAKTFNVSLYPWDAGVRRGHTYIQRDAEDEVPRRPIRGITRDWPQGNPFSVEDNGQLRPVATVTIERLSPKKDYLCDRKPMAGVKAFKPVQDEGEQYGRPGKSKINADRTKQLPPNLQSMIPTMCFMTPWSAWTPCSATCGSGTMMRRRRIVRNLKPPLCKYVKLKEKRECMGPARTCNHSLPCSVTEWSTWSPCNASCNSEGKRIRNRNFIRSSEAEVCARKVQIKEMMSCTYRCDESITCSAPMIEGYPCYAPVKRYYYNMKKKQCLPFTYRGCKGSKNNFKSKQDCHRVCDNAFNSLAKWKINRAAQLQEDATRKKMLASKGKSMRSCKKPKNEGHLCRRRKRRKGRQSPQMRWYFDKKSKSCREMKFKGCSGNDNNFLSLDDCRTTCRQLMKMKNVITGPPQNCKVGNWGPWGPCDSVCGGRRMRSRRVVVPPRNGGRRCPPFYQFAECKRRNCKPCAYTPWTGWSACTTTCGGGVMERTRSRMRIKQDNCTPDQPPEFMQRTSCNDKPCPLIFFYHRKQ